MLNEKSWDAIYDKVVEIASIERVESVKGSGWEISSLIDEVISAVVPLVIELHGKSVRVFTDREGDLWYETTKGSLSLGADTYSRSIDSVEESFGPLVLIADITVGEN